jgi:hypothetical protein
MGLVYALARQLPLPGLDPNFAGYGALARASTRLSVAALGVTPFIGAVLLFEIARLAAPPLARWAASPANAGRFDTIVWALALVLAASQGFAVARGIEAVQGVVDEPGAAFEGMVAATMLGATAILGALARMTRRAGAGDGFLIIFVAPMLIATASQAETSWRHTPAALDAAVVIVATALLIVGALASRRALPGPLGFGGGPLDPLPPLIGMMFAGLPALAPLAFGAPALEGAERTMATAAFGAALIALVAAMRANLPGATEPRRAPWPATLATIGVAAGLPLVQLAAPSLSLPSGYAMVFVVAAALSVLEALRPAARD